MHSKSLARVQAHTSLAVPVCGDSKKVGSWRDKDLRDILPVLWPSGPYLYRLFSCLEFLSNRLALLFRLFRNYRLSARSPLLLILVRLPLSFSSFIPLLTFQNPTPLVNGGF